MQSCVVVGNDLTPPQTPICRPHDADAVEFDFETAVIEGETEVWKGMAAGAHDEVNDPAGYAPTQPACVDWGEFDFAREVNLPASNASLPDDICASVLPGDAGRRGFAAPSRGLSAMRRSDPNPDPSVCCHPPRHASCPATRGAP